MRPETQAVTLLERLGIRSAPIDVWRVARRLGVRVERTDLGEDCSGVLVRRKSGAAVIGVNYAHHPNRQRFTVAHELGHLVLHKGGRYVDKGTTLRFRDRESGTGSQVEERQANQFAAALLMPATWVRREFAKHPFDFGDDEALTEMCRKFGVSSQAMVYRLVNLALLNESPASERATA